MEIIARQTRDNRLKRIVFRMAESIRGGSTLEEAARRESKYLPRFFVELVGAGEMGGRLDEIFDNLATYYERTYLFVRQIVTSLIYPGMQLLVFFLVATLMGALNTCMSEQGLNVDELIRVYLGMLGRSLLVGLIVLVVAIVLARAGLLKWVAALFSTFVWPVAPVIRKSALARFARSLGLLVRSGVPITEAVRKAAATTSNPYIERSLLQCVPAIQAGNSVSSALSKCPYLSEMARELIYTGEESGKLDFHLAKIAEIHEDEAVQAARVLVRVAGILILLAIAVLVGWFVIRFYVGYFNSLLGDLDV
jgi:type IV pilus assembly protein PilC